MAGDFNLHHPMWNPFNYDTHDQQADELAELMGSYGLTQMLPKGTITYPSAGTTIDLVWGNQRAEQRIIKCQIADYDDHSSDHRPIETILDILPITSDANVQAPLDYEKMDTKTFKAKLPTYLPRILNPANTNPLELDQYTETVVQAIQKAIQETTPRKRPSPFSKRWWTEDLTKQRREMNHHRRKFQQTREETDKNEWKKRQQEYFKAIKKAKRETWNKFVKEADERSIWKIKKYMDNIQISTYVPMLNEHAATNEEKTKELKEAFFPPPPPADLTDIRETTDYPDEFSFNQQITMEQLQRAVEKLAPNKAPGPDEISNHSK